jgi:hypothetical protein
MTQSVRALTIVLFLALGAPVAAHHSAAQFDFSKSVSITGVVK